MGIVHDIGDVKRFFDSIRQDKPDSNPESAGPCSLPEKERPQRGVPEKKERRFSVKKGYNVTPEGEKVRTAW
jgi:hypothetical protein